MSDPCLYANAWTAALAAAADASSAAIVLADTDAQLLIDRLAAPAGMSPLCYLTLGATEPREVVLVMAIGAAQAGTRTLTVVRARDGTAPQSWPAGAAIGALLPRAGLESLRSGYRPDIVPELMDFGGADVWDINIDPARPLRVLAPTNSFAGCTIIVHPPAAAMPPGWAWVGRILIAPPVGGGSGQVQVALDGDIVRPDVFIACGEGGAAVVEFMYVGGMWAAAVLM